VSRLEEARGRSSGASSSTSSKTSSSTNTSSDSPSTSRTPQMDTLFQKLDSMNLSAEQQAAMGSVDYDSLWSSSKIPVPSQEEVLKSMQENGACLAGTACMHAAALCVRPRSSQRRVSTESCPSCTVQVLLVVERE
jgi:predicted NAD/FAD-dependent oxidoreductase